MAENEDLRTFAYHEAGHAVVAWALGLRVIGVSIGTQGDCGPHTQLDEARPPSLFQALIINQGASAAENLFEAPTNSRARLRDRYKAEREIIPLLKLRKSAVMTDA